MSKLTPLPIVIALSAVLSACGGGSGGNSSPANISPAINTNTPEAPVGQAQEEAEELAVIRGVIDETLPSAALPSASLPSLSLPSTILPSISLPSFELDEIPSQIELRTLKVVLEASQEVSDEPLAPGNEDLFATAIVEVNETTGEIKATVKAENLDVSDTITMVHIHSAFAGENGGILAGFASTADPLVFELTTNIASLADIPGNDLETFLDGGWYINLHTASNPAGQLRGQMFTDEIDVVRLEMEGQQENPAVINAPGISGITYATINVPEEELVLNTSVEGFVPFLDAPVGPVHLHAGFAGENGPVILPLQPVNGSETVFRGTEADAIDTLDFDQIALGGYYMNVHSAANPSGEIRGQVVPANIEAIRMELQGQQENPPVENELGVAGIAYATFDPYQERIVINASVEGFVPFLDAPVGPVHLHAGFAGENGPVILPLQPVDGSETVFRGTELDAIDVLDFEQLAQGGHYLNIHSAANPSGELRGQVVPLGVDAVRMELEGQQENPPVQNEPGISGIAYATFDKFKERIVLNTTVEGFVPFLDAPVGPVHLHAGFAGENGPVILPLQPVDGSDTVYRGTEADAIAELDFEQLVQGGHYINVHSAANASGELRGQVVPLGVDAVRSELQGQQENPAVINEPGISGITYTTFNAVKEQIVVNTTVEGFIPFLNAPVGPVHLHAGFAGENGPVILPLQPVDGSDTVFRGTEADIIAPLNFDQLAQGGHYMNVHSAANPSGEVRGQVVPRNVEAARIELQGQQENPPVENAPGVSGIAYATYNVGEERIVLNTTVEGFIPFLDAPVGPVHLHAGFAGINGPVVLPLQAVDGSDTVFRGTEADIIAPLDFVQLAQGGHYINVHSAENASGEVRGQVVSSNSTVLRAELTGDQALPADDTSATGIGYLTVTDLDNGLFLSNVSLVGLDDDATVEVRTGGNNNVPFIFLDESDAVENLFSSPIGSVRNLNGLLNGAYAFQAEGEEGDDS